MNLKSGDINIEVTQDKGHYRLTVEDNGVGLPPDFSLKNINSLGFEIILSLVEQLNGKIEYKNKNGACFEVVFEM